MPDPFTNPTAAAAKIFNDPLFKLFFYLIGPTFAAVIVMLLAQPHSTREWLAALISTLITSLGLGAYVLKKYIGLSDIQTLLDLMQLGGVFFVCGLPGWILVRALFLFGEKNKHKTLLEIIKELKGLLK